MKLNEPTIRITHGVRSGQPCIRNMRLTVKDVLSYLASGMTEGEVMEDFPGLTKKDIQVCKEYKFDQ